MMHKRRETQGVEGGGRAYLCEYMSAYVCVCVYPHTHTLTGVQADGQRHAPSQDHTHTDTRVARIGVRADGRRHAACECNVTRAATRRRCRAITD